MSQRSRRIQDQHGTLWKVSQRRSYMGVGDPMRVISHDTVEDAELEGRSQPRLLAPPLMMQAKQPGPFGSGSWDGDRWLGYKALRSIRMANE